MVRLDVDMEAGVRTPDSANFVEIMFARNLDEADRLRRILEDRFVPAQTERNSDLPMQCGVAVLVPSDRLVDASELLTKMAHDDEDDDFVIEDDDDADDEFEDDDEPELDGDDSEFGDDDDDLDEEEEDI